MYFGSLVPACKTLICTLVIAGTPILGGVKLHIEEGRLLVDGVYVNGHGPYRFLLDTGSTLNHMEPKLARAIGLTPTFRTELRSSAGVTAAEGAEGIEVAIDSVHADGQTFLFAGVDVIRQFSPDVQGVLGQVFLSRFDYFLDLRGKRIEFGKREPAGQETRVPFRAVQGRPVVSTSLGSLVLDSGVRWVTRFSVEATRLTHEMFTMTGSRKVGTISSNLLIGDRTFWHGQALAIPGPAEEGAEGLLPVSLFRAVYVCNSEGYLVFD